MYTALDERHPDAKVIVPPRADAVLSATADTDPTQRDRHIQAIAGKGRMAWQRDSGYNERARVEGQFARWKQVIGDGLRFHSDEARATEVAIAAQVLNRMLDLDARTPSASHDQQRGMGAPLPLPPPCNTLSLLISNSTIRAACSIRPNNSSGKFYWSRCCVWSPMLWAASLATRAVASEILTLLLSMRCTSAFSRSLCAAMKSCGDRARMMLFMPSIWHCTAFRV